MAGPAPVGLGTISNHQRGEAEAKALTRLQPQALAGAGAAPLPSPTPVSAHPDCCDQPRFKHVSIDQGECVCGVEVKRRQEKGLPQERGTKGA